MFKLVFAFTALALLSACTNQSFREATFVPSEDNSRALNLAKAAGLKRMEDVEVDVSQINQALPPENPSGLSDPSNTYMVSQTALAMHTSTAFTSLDLTMLALSLFIGGEQRAESRAIAFGWAAPEHPGVAPSLSSITANAFDGLTSYFSKEMPSLEFALGTLYSANGKNIRTYIAVMPEDVNGCGPVNSEPKDMCSIAAWHPVSGARDIYGDFFEGIVLSKETTITPPGKPYLWRSFLNNNFVYKGVKADTLSIYSALSKSLPEDAYIFLGSKSYTYTGENGKIYDGMAPLILDHGKPLFFIKGREEG